MKIKTKYNVGDKCWVMYKDRPMEIIIACIKTETEHNSLYDIEYEFQCNGYVSVNENDLFDTKEELLKSL